MAMLGTRITHKTIFEGSMNNLQHSLQRSQRLQEQLSSGKRIVRPSDDATGTISALQDRAHKRALTQQLRNVDDGKGWLSTADSALQSALTSTRAAYTKLVNVANDGGQGNTSREALAKEIEELRDNILNLANTQYHGRPVFGGTNSEVKAYTTTGGASPTFSFRGNLGVPADPTGKVNRQITDAETIEVNSPGDQIFQADVPTYDPAPAAPADPSVPIATTPAGTVNQSIFQILTDAAAAIRNGDRQERIYNTQIAIERTQKVMDRMANGLSGIGTRYNRIDSVSVRGADHELELQSRIATIENIDLPKTIMELQLQDVAHKAALGATARAMQPSLLDFLR